MCPTGMWERDSSRTPTASWMLFTCATTGSRPNMPTFSAACIPQSVEEILSAAQTPEKLRTKSGKRPTTWPLFFRTHTKKKVYGRGPKNWKDVQRRGRQQELD